MVLAATGDRRKLGRNSLLVNPALLQRHTLWRLIKERMLPMAHVRSQARRASAEGFMTSKNLLDDEDVVASYPLDAPPFGRSLAISPSCPQVGDPWVLKRLTSGAKGC